MGFLVIQMSIKYALEQQVYSDKLEVDERRVLIPIGNLALAANKWRLPA